MGSEKRLPKPLKSATLSLVLPMINQNHPHNGRKMRSGSPTRSNQSSSSKQNHWYLTDRMDRNRCSTTQVS